MGPVGARSTSPEARCILTRPCSFNGVRQFLKNDRKSGLPHRPLLGAYFGCAIAQEQDTPGSVHIDVSDYAFGLNVVCCWGPFASSKIRLYPLQTAFEMVPGDIVFFLGRVLVHGVGDIVGGRRNMFDCYSHETVMSWADRMRHHEQFLLGKATLDPEIDEKIQKYGYFPRNAANPKKHSKQAPKPPKAKASKSSETKGKGKAIEENSEEEQEEGAQTITVPDTEPEDAADLFASLESYLYQNSGYHT